MSRNSANKINIYKCVEGNAEIVEEPPKETFQQREPRLYVLKQLRIALCLAIGNLTVGYSIGWATSIIPKLMQDPLLTSLPYLILENDASCIVNTMIIGAVVGSLISGFTANRAGRKPILLLTSSFNILGYAIMAKAANVSTMTVGRFVAGMAAGSILVINVIYIGEIASPEIRGSLIAMGGIMHVFGNLLVCSQGPHVSVQVVCYVCVSISCVHVLALFYVPESHVYQAMKGKHNEARLTLHDLGRSEDIEEDLKLISKHSNEALLPQRNDGHGKVAKRWLIRLERKNIRGFFVTAVLLCIQATRGRIAVIYLATTIFKSSSPSVNPGVVLELTELCGVIMTPLLVERCGRRIMLMMSLGFCCLFMTILGTCLYLEVNRHVMTDSIKWLPLALIMLFLFAYNFGVGIVPNILSSELFSPPFRSTCCSIAMSLAWSVLWHSWKFEHLATEIFNPEIFYISAGINAMGLFFVIFVVPETTGKSLKEIGNLLERHRVF